MSETEKTDTKKKDPSKGYFLAWRDWCMETKAEPNVECLMDWDSKHNKDRIRKMWTRDTIMKAGVLAMYRQFFYRYAMLTLKAGDTSFRMSAIRVATETGEMRFIDGLGAQSLEFIKARLKAAIAGDSVRLAALGMDWEQIRREVVDAFEGAREKMLTKTESRSSVGSMPMGAAPAQL